MSASRQAQKLRFNDGKGSFKTFEFHNSSRTRYVRQDPNFNRLLLGLGLLLLLRAQKHDDRFNFFCVQLVAKRTHRRIRDAFGNIAGDGVIGFAVLKFSADQAWCARLWR